MRHDVSSFSYCVFSRFCASERSGCRHSHHLLNLGRQKVVTSQNARFACGPLYIPCDSQKDSDVEASDFKGKDHVIYYGQTKRKLSKKLLSLISGVKKPVVAIGYNAGQISQFSGLSLARKENVFQVHSRSEKADVSLESGLNVLSVSGLKGTALYTFKADEGTTHSFIWKTKKGMCTLD